MNEFTLKVSESAMIRQAGLITSNVERIRASLDSIKSAVCGSRYYWEGEASDLHVKNYTKTEPEMDEVLSRLREHPTDLLRMAGIYRECEQKNTDTAGSLPDNVIV